MSVPNRKLSSSDFTTTIHYTNGVKVVCQYLILKCWHFDGSVSIIEMHNPNARTDLEAEEILLYSYNKAEESTIEDVYKFDKLKGRCFQYVNGVEKMSWEPALWG